MTSAPEATDQVIETRKKNRAVLQKGAFVGSFWLFREQSGSRVVHVNRSGAIQQAMLSTDAGTLMIEWPEDRADGEKREPVASDPIDRSKQGCLKAERDMDMPSSPDSSLPTRLVLALAWIKARRARNHVFSVDLFSDPAWDMLLDLYVNWCRDQRVSITDLCIASSAPMTTGLRWISILENRGLIARQADASDRRRWNVSLTADGLEKMGAALDAAAQSDRQLGLGRLGLVD